jgi:hypothetical protein
MSAAVCERGRQTRVQTVVRVSEGERYVGDILLDGEGRVWRHAVTIPKDVVLKALVGHTRHAETCGTLTGRSDGRVYLWYVVGGLAEANAAADD